MCATIAVLKLHDSTDGVCINILIVEDDPLNRRVVRDMLSVAGLPLDEAADGEIGLSMVDQNNYDVVLMDLRMPGMDGITAIQHIRARHDDKAKVPIIVVTADAAANLQELCAGVGANAFLQKPIAMNDLFDTIGKVAAAEGRSLALL